MTLDGSNSPVLHPHDQFKVIFESGFTMSFAPVASVFNDGDLLGVPIGQRAADRADHERLVVEVLPGDLRHQSIDGITVPPRVARPGR